jgi:hypothetical protein
VPVATSCILAKIRSRPRVGIGTSRQSRHGDVATMLAVAGAIGLAHPSGAEDGDDLVRAEASAGTERHPAISWAGISRTTS